jgi:hypothetical protein
MIMIPALLLGCGPSAQERAAQDYVAGMTPLLKDNTKLSRYFLELAAQIKKQRASPQQISDKLQAEIIPAARALHTGAEAIQPGVAPLNGIHIGLVRAWYNRVQAYESMHRAWVADDLVAFEGATSDHKTVFKAEARYFDSIGPILAEYQLSLTQYP